MDALDIWGVLLPYNWALKARGSVFPYFCTVLQGEIEPIKVRFLLLEGWQTLQNYLHTRQDHFFGVYSSPMELPHFELIVLKSGELKLYRHDTGYLPQEVTGGAQYELAVKLLWEAYGVMLRLESDQELPMKYSQDGAMFARVEKASGEWEDQPLPLIPVRPYTEKVSLSKAEVKKASDLPFLPKEALAVDFRLVTGLFTQEKRPRTVYELVAFDHSSKREVIRTRMSVVPEAGLKAMWENMPGEFLHRLIQLGKIPGELHLCSGRVFRFLRPLCIELPIKLIMHDKLDELA